MSRSVWVINEVGWEYDDSNYYRVDGVKPFQAYTDFEIANAFLKEKKADTIRSLNDDIFGYIDEYSINEVINNKESLERIAKIGINISDDACYSKPTFIKNMNEYTDEELIEVAEIFSIEFYSLMEVELIA